MVQTLQVYSQPHYWGERLNDDDDDFKMTKNQLFFSQHFFSHGLCFPTSISEALFQFVCLQRLLSYLLLSFSDFRRTSDELKSSGRKRRSKNNYKSIVVQISSRAKTLSIFILAYFIVAVFSAQGANLLFCTVLPGHFC